jgi:aminocarboxymuconate-semialdehyde decarboxylase
VYLRLALKSAIHLQVQSRECDGEIHRTCGQFIIYGLIEEKAMPNRREFLRNVAGASAGMFLLSRDGDSAAEPAPQASAPSKRREVMVGKRRVKTVDVHAHVTVPEVAELIKGTPLERRGGSLGNYDDKFSLAVRLQRMDEEGIDIQALSINSFWYSADRDLASRLVNLQNEKLAGMCATHPDRFVAFASVALQFPDLAAQQLEEGVKRWGLRGGAIGGTVPGQDQELSSSKFDPFWAKAEELQAPIFMHPQDSANATGVNSRVQGNGVLSNVIGNPLETTIFLSHMILEGTLDRFPNLKICAAHGGGFLPSYGNRMDHGCRVFPIQCTKTLKKKPSEYLRQLYYDAIVFTPEALRHLVAVCGASQIGMGTDYPFPWTVTPVDEVFAAPGLSDADRVAILGGNMCKLLKIPA